MTSMKIDSRAVMGALVIVFVLALAYSTVSSYLVKYMTVTEAMSLDTNEMIWVNGSISKGSMNPLDTGEYVFVITDGVSSMNVSFTGELPNSLGADADVVIYGTPVDGKFRAVRMISRCPTKYQG